MNNFAQFLLVASFLFAAISSFIIYKHSLGKHRLLLFFLTIIGCFVTFYSGWNSLKENQERQSELNGYRDGESVIPQVRLALGTDKQYWVFKLINNSQKYTLYQIKVWAIPVSTDAIFYYDPEKPLVILEDTFLQPTSEVETDLEYPHIVINKYTPEWRFNFYIRCKHGYFYEQLILREVDGQFVEAVRIMKDNKIVYQTQIEPGFLFPGEDKVIFHDRTEGIIKGTKKEEYEKWQTRKKYLPY